MAASLLHELVQRGLVRPGCLGFSGRETVEKKEDLENFQGSQDDEDACNVELDIVGDVMGRGRESEEAIEDYDCGKGEQYEENVQAESGTAKDGGTEVGATMTEAVPSKVQQPTKKLLEERDSKDTLDSLLDENSADRINTDSMKGQQKSRIVQNPDIKILPTKEEQTAHSRPYCSTRAFLPQHVMLLCMAGAYCYLPAVSTISYVCPENNTIILLHRYSPWTFPRLTRKFLNCYSFDRLELNVTSLLSSTIFYMQTRDTIVF